MKALCLLSGGLDSAVALWWARAEGFELTTASFQYQGRPRREAEAARRLSRRAGALRHHQIPLPVLQPLQGALQGYLPKRNLVFYSLAAALAEEAGLDALVGGHLATDAADFPDASAGYFRRVEKLLNVVPGGRPRLKILLPLIGLSKTQVSRLGRKLGCPLELSWSCYRDGGSPCGSCAACRERSESLGSVACTDPVLRRCT